MWETLETETEFSSIFTFPKVKIVKAYLDIWDRRQVYYILARSSCRREHTPPIFSCLNLKIYIYIAAHRIFTLLSLLLLLVMRVETVTHLYGFVCARSLFTSGTSAVSFISENRKLITHFHLELYQATTYTPEHKKSSLCFHERL